MHVDDRVLLNRLSFKQALLAKGVTQRSLTIALGIHESDFSGMVNGIRRPRRAVAMRIAAALGTTLDAITDSPSKTVAA